MSSDDQKRLEREASIAEAKKGPDTAQRDKFVRRVKDRAAKLTQDSSDKYAKERAAYYEADARGEIQRIDGEIPRFRDDPTGRER